MCFLFFVIGTDKEAILLFDASDLTREETLQLCLWLSSRHVLQTSFKYFFMLLICKSRLILSSRSSTASLNDGLTSSQTKPDLFKLLLISLFFILFAKYKFIQLLLFDLLFVTCTIPRGCPMLCD